MTTVPIGSNIIQQPNGSAPLNISDVIIHMATAADEFPRWGEAPARRDRELRAFWHTEPILAGAVFSTISRYSAFGWTLTGPTRTVRIVQKLLHGVEFGAGWAPLMSKVLIDLFTQDNGAFIEIVRAEDSPTSPVITLNHLDSSRCVRTGRYKEPVIYYDINGKGHQLKWYQVIPLAEFPSPVEAARGMQYCTITRILRAAQIIREWNVYKKEKISGRFTRAIHLVSGVQKKTIDEAVTGQQTAVQTDRYLQPLIIASLDPNANVNVATIALASMPDGFNAEIEFKWYVAQLALAFGSDYQDFAPLPGGNLGTAEQSETLHLKARGKGAKLFMSLIEHAMNFQGIMPNTVHFSFGDQDLAEDEQQARLRKLRAEERKIRIESGEITPEIARQLAEDVGDLDAAYLQALNEPDVMGEVRVSGESALQGTD